MGRKSIWPPRPIRHLASGQDRVQWQGKTYYLGRSGSPEARRAYVELIQRLEGQQQPLGSPGPAEGTIGQLLLLWSLHAAQEYGLEERNFAAALVPLSNLYSNLPVKEFALSHLRRVREAMQERGWCRSHINRSIIRIRTVWRWAEQEGLAPPGIWAALRALAPLRSGRQGARESARVQPVEWDQVEPVVRICPEGLRRLILLGWWTGARPGELAALTCEMIDRSRDPWTAQLELHKNAWRGQDRVLFFGPEAQAVILERLDQADAQADPSRPVCLDGRGKPWNRRSLYQAVRRWCRRAGVTPWHPYQLRHAAKRRFVRVVGLDAARCLLGQRSLSATERYASGLDWASAAESAKRVA